MKLVVVHVALVGLALVVVLALVTVTTYTPVVLITLAVAHVMRMTVVVQALNPLAVLLTAVTVGASPVGGK
jgi:hypothetical protein